MSLKSLVVILSVWATRSAVALAICVTRRSMVSAWLNSSVPSSSVARMGTSRANSTAAMPLRSRLRGRSHRTRRDGRAVLVASKVIVFVLPVAPPGACSYLVRSTQLASGSVEGLVAEGGRSLDQSRATRHVSEADEGHQLGHVPLIECGDQHDVTPRAR